MIMLNNRERKALLCIIPMLDKDAAGKISEPKIQAVCDFLRQPIQDEIDLFKLEFDIETMIQNDTKCRPMPVKAMSMNVSNHNTTTNESFIQSTVSGKTTAEAKSDFENRNTCNDSDYYGNYGTDEQFYDDEEEEVGQVLSGEEEIVWQHIE